MDSAPATTRPTRARRAAESVFAAAVFGFLLSFPVRTVLSGPADRTVPLAGENRAATPFPDLRAAPPEEWGRGVDAWYGDAMPGRRWFVKQARAIDLKTLRSPFGGFVPGRGKQWFLVGKDWPELEDYLGSFRLSDRALDRWADLFAGRRAWAEAMGCTFVSVLSPTKVQTMPDAPFPWISRHRGECLFDQLRTHLDRLGETGSVLSVRAALRSPADGRPLFLPKAEHHPDPEGLYRVYEAIAAAIPGCGVSPWFGGAPPPEVAAGRAPGCWADGRFLRVSAPGSEPFDSPFLALAKESKPAGNQRSAAVRRGGGPGLHVVLAHTSYLRYTFSSWDAAREPVLFPFDARTARIDSLLWKFLGEADLDYLTSESVPDAIVQEINEWHLSQFPVGWSAAVSAAAAFGRAEAVSADAAPAPDDPVCVRAILADVDAGGLRSMPLSAKGPRATATLLRDGEPVASARVNPGVRRPVFFPPVPFGGGAFRVEVSGGSARLESLDVRQAAAAAAR